MPAPDPDQSPETRAESSSADVQLAGFVAELASVFARHPDVLDGNRAALLAPGAAADRLVDALSVFVPDKVDAATWRAWLDGGAQFKERRPGRPSSSGASNKALMGMKAASIRKAEAAVQQAREELRQAESSLEQHVLTQKAWLQFVLIEKLTAFLKPVFAMGPAWVLMRALAVPFPATDEFVARHGEDAAEPLAELKGDLTGLRVEPRSVIFRTLQGLAGDGRLEAELFVEIYRVCKRHSARAEEKIRGRGVSNNEFTDDPTDRPDRLRNLEGGTNEAQ